MKLSPKHYIEIICAAADLPQYKAKDLFHHKWTMHIYENENFIIELDKWIKNIYDMYKQHLYLLQKKDPQKRNIEQMYGDNILMEDMVDAKFKPQHMEPVNYNKQVSGKLNNAFLDFRNTVTL
jgi:hypothetical protein